MGAEGAEPRRRRCPEGRGLAEGAEPRAEVRKPGRAPHVEGAEDPQAVGGEAAARCEPVGVRREEEEGVGSPLCLGGLQGEASIVALVARGGGCCGFRCGSAGGNVPTELLGGGGGLGAAHPGAASPP